MPHLVALFVLPGGVGAPQNWWHYYSALLVLMPLPPALFVLPGGVGAPLNWWHHYSALWHHWKHHWGHHWHQHKESILYLINSEGRKKYRQSIWTNMGDLG